MSQITCESFNELDDEIKQEFYEDVKAAIKDVNECATILEAGADAAVIDRMFRSLHTVKGNCNMVFLDVFVDVTHKLEDLFSDIRSGDIAYNDTFGKFAVTAINAIEIQIDSTVTNQFADSDILGRLEQIIDQIEHTSPEDRLEVAEKAIIAVQDGHYNLELVAVDEEHGKAFSFLDATDFEFFQFISDQKVKVAPEHHDFIEICETLALKLNEKLGQSIDEQQLKTAVMFAGFSQSLASDEFPTKLKIEQVFFASGLLSRMPGWKIAADVCLQLLESFDGSGSPYGLKDSKIMPASQALALAVEFTLLVLKNKQKGYKQSLFTAVKLINAQKDTRFKGRLIERFNTVIKSEYLTNQMW